MVNTIRARFFVAAIAVAAMGFTAYALVSRSDKALVYCPVGIDAAGCDVIVNALSGSDGPFPGGVDRGYDGSAGTIDLATADLSQYAVLVVPSLADGGDSKPYELLRNRKIAYNLSSALGGRLAIWSGTPDQGATNRTEKNRLIRNLAVWARGETSTQSGGIVVLQDHSDDASARYQWLAGIAGFVPRADPTLAVYDVVQSLTPTASAILDNGGQQLVYVNMASFGLEPPPSASGAVVDARSGIIGGLIDGKAVLITAARRLASAQSDQKGYKPGEVVTITGSGWKAGESVTLNIHQEPTLRTDATLTATADAAGTILLNAYTIQAHDVATQYYVTAKGQSSSLAAQTTFVDAAADLAITKSASPNPVNPGAVLTYTLTVRNQGPNTATEVIVEDQLPSNVTFLSASGGGFDCALDPATNMVRCTRASLAVNETAIITIRVRAPNQALVTLINVANVRATQADANQTNNRATTTTIVAGPAVQVDFSIVKTGPTTASAGTTIEYKLTVKNNGPNNSTGGTVTDMLPAGVTFVSASQGCTNTNGTVRCSVGALARDASQEFTITVSIAPGFTGIINNTATVQANEFDPNAANNASTAQTTVAAPTTDLSIEKTGPATAVAGTTIEYKLTVKNNGPNNSTGGTVTDVLPAGVTFVSASEGCTNPNGTVTCTVDALALDASQEFTITVRIAPNFTGTAVTNTATVDANETDPNTTNDSDTATTTVTAEPDVTIIKTAPPTAPQGSIIYTLTVSNTGPSTALGVTVTDNLPSGVSFGSVQTSQGTCTQSGGTVTCNIGTMEPGASTVITITVTATACGAVTNTATVSATNEPASKTGNNSASATTTIDCPAAHVTGGGHIHVVHNGSTGRAHFGFNVRRKTANAKPTGELQYIDHVIRLNVHGKSMLTLLANGTHAEFSGTCTISGATNCTFYVWVDDLGESGKSDSFRIKVEYTDGSGSRVYTQGGTIERGNIQIHGQQ